MKNPSAKQGRAAFTLVELMVVIAIIGVLVSLVSIVASRAISKANVGKNQHDISQLASALEAFKTRYGFYPPSRIRLCSNYATYAASPSSTPGFDNDSTFYISQMFPKLTQVNPKNSPNPYWTGIPWDGSTTNGDWTLEGDQCLVFFLGGIPFPSGTPGCQGFANDPTNPTNLASEKNPISFHDFQSNRLANIPHTIAGGTRAFYSYLDTYGKSNPLGNSKPYLYFSSYKSANGYARYGTGSSGDCQTFGVSPYAERLNPTRYRNPNSFQIISAGKDQRFGQGSTAASSLWTPSTAATTTGWAVDPSNASNLQAGFDDQSNFYGSPLGTSQ